MRQRHKFARLHSKDHGKYVRLLRENMAWRGVCAACGKPRGKGREEKRLCKACQKAEVARTKDERNRRACLQMLVSRVAAGNGFMAAVARALLAEVERRMGGDVTTDQKCRTRGEETR